MIPGGSTGGLIVDARSLTKVYGPAQQPLVALGGVDVAVGYGEIVALTGPSGCGKSTLLNLLGCLDRPTSGEYRLGGCDVSTLSAEAQAWVRLHYLGFVFQSFHLVASTTAVDNVAMPLYYAGVPRGKRQQRALELLDRVGLADRRDHRPEQLSGGQRQRVAVARALANNPRLILADEPTGALDTRTGAEIIELLRSIRDEDGVTVLLVTHDPHIAAQADRQIMLQDGKLMTAAPAPTASTASTGEGQGAAL